MYVCMYVCMFLMYVCMCVCQRESMDGWMDVLLYVCVYMHTYVRASMHILVCAFAIACKQACTCGKAPRLAKPHKDDAPLWPRLIPTRLAPTSLRRARVSKYSAQPSRLCLIPSGPRSPQTSPQTRARQSPRSLAQLHPHLVLMGVACVGLRPAWVMLLHPAQTYPYDDP